MNGLIIRVCAYHGDPIDVGGIPTRAGYCHDEPIPGDLVVNAPEGDRVKDLNIGGATSDYGLLSLVEDFEDEHSCKVNFDDPPVTEEGITVFEFDVFEPSCQDEDEAQEIIDELTERLVDWVQGYPTGR